MPIILELREIAASTVTRHHSILMPSGNPSPLLAYQDYILHWFFVEGQTMFETRQLLHRQFPEIKSISYSGSDYPSIRTLERTIREWGYIRNPRQLVESDEFQQRLRVLFFEFALSDDEILRFLRRDGFDITLPR